MPTYIILGSYSDQGIRNVRQSPERLDAARQVIESSGGSIRFFLTMGQYDIVSIVEAPSDEVFASTVLAIGSQGNVRTTSLKAFPEEEFRRIIGAMPSA